MIPFEVNKDRAPPKQRRDEHFIVFMITSLILNLEVESIIMLNREVSKLVISVESNREGAVD